MRTGKGCGIYIVENIFKGYKKPGGYKLPGEHGLILMARFIQPR